MSGEDLIVAIGDIDAKYIVEAETTLGASIRSARSGNGKRSAVKPWAFATAVCGFICALVIGIVLPVYVFGGKSDQANSGGSSSHPAKEGRLHSTMSNYYGSATFADMTDSSVTLDIKINDVANWITWDIVLSAFEQDGERRTNYYFATASDAVINGVVRLENAIVTINGVVSENYVMPTAVGEYNVVIDISPSIEQGKEITLSWFEICGLRFDCTQ